MPTPEIDTVLGWRGRDVLDRAGEKIGKFEDMYLDTESDLPEWAAVRIGLLGRRHALVPLSEASEAGKDLQVPFDKDQVEAAPEVDADGELSKEEEAALYRHYGLDYSTEESQSVLPPQAAEGDAPESTGTAAEQDSGAMTRSEEEVVSVRGGQMRPRERVRLKKYVVTEEVPTTIPVQREEIRLEHDDPPAGDERRG